MALQRQYHYDAATISKQVLAGMGEEKGQMMLRAVLACMLIIAIVGAITIVFLSMTITESSDCNCCPYHILASGWSVVAILCSYLVSCVMHDEEG